MVQIAARRSSLRLTLAGFGAGESDDIAVMLRVVSSSALPWMLVNSPPYDAVLLARGTREGDADKVAVLRVASEMIGRTGIVRDPLPLLLPRPIQESTLKLALEAAVARLQARGVDPRR
jgi:hypothetical protein